MTLRQISGYQRQSIVAAKHTRIEPRTQAILHCGTALWEIARQVAILNGRLAEAQSGKTRRKERKGKG